MKFSIQDFFSKFDQITNYKRITKSQIWSHLLKKSSMENFILCAMKRSWAPCDVLKKKFMVYFRKRKIRGYFDKSSKK